MSGYCVRVRSWTNVRILCYVEESNICPSTCLGGFGPVIGFLLFYLVGSSKIISRESQF